MLENITYVTRENEYKDNTFERNITNEENQREKTTVTKETILRGKRP